jgi:hypothetical protein
MSDHVTNYVSAQDKLMEAFKCPENYLVKSCLDYSWKINRKEDITLLEYHRDGADRMLSVVLKSGGAPLIYKYGAYCMIVVIECVKTAIILKNSMREE